MHTRHSVPVTLSLMVSILILLPAFFPLAAAQSPSQVERIPAEEARASVLSGDAFLVCAYDDQRCSGMMLEGALTKTEFEKKLPTLSKDQEIITYCG